PVPVVVGLTRVTRSDGAALFFGTLALLAAARVAESPTRNRFLQAGAALGLAISTKYYLGVFGLFLALATLDRPRREVARGWALAAGACLAVFLLTSPAFLFQFAAVSADLNDEMHARRFVFTSLAHTVA